MTTKEDRARLVAGLREAADLIEAHPELPTPFVTGRDESVDVSWSLSAAYQRLTPAGQSAAAQRVISGLGVEWRRYGGPRLTHCTARRGDLYLSVSWDPTAERTTEAAS